MITFHVKFVGLDKWEAALKKAASTVRPAFIKAAVAGCEIIGQRASQNFANKHGYGRLASSITTVPFDKGTEFGAKVGTSLPYSTIFEKKTAWSKKPPSEPVKKWAQSRLGLTPDEATLFYIRWVKKKFPYMVEPTPYMQPAINQSLSTIEILFSSALRELFR